MSSPGPDITPAVVRQAAGTGALILDNREDGEWAAGHTPDAVHTPLSQVDPAALDPAVAIIAICRSGGYSGKATARLAVAGPHARNMSGGMIAWQKAGLSVVRDDGTPGTIA